MGLAHTSLRHARLRCAKIGNAGKSTKISTTRQNAKVPHGDTYESSSVLIFLSHGPSNFLRISQLSASRGDVLALRVADSGSKSRVH